MSMQRQFTSGSRQAPDPFDQFLEENNFYRKHTARDASCLFRVISEQMYDTQLHHLAIRKKCVRYMRKHRDFFAPLIDRDLDEYLDDMSKPKTYGTLIELQAVGYMFQRNVLLFEPFNLGNFYSSRSYFNDVFRVFYTPERHFDSVFTCDYIKDAAICQAICYEILYKDLYKLPDVAFAVEHMLHSPTLESMEYTSESNEDGYCTRIHLTDGRVFNFDLPHETNCILENYELCHFHYSNFPRLSDDLHREMKIHTNCDDYEKTALCKTAESLLPHKYISCVRQLLQEGITPFPYKVAKALDPNMYRNIEFDAWNEQRKEQKLQNWYNGDTNFKVGAKCHVKLCKSENDVYTCHIQEIAVDKGYCIVFIEQLGEKRLVPYESLTPLPPDQFKPWTLPYRFQRHMQKYSSVRLTRHYNYRFKLNGQLAEDHNYCAPISHNGKPIDYVAGITGGDADKADKQNYAAAAGHHRNGCYYKLKQYTHFENFRAHTVEYCAMPLTVEHAPRELESKSGSATTTPSNENNTNVAQRAAIPETRIKTEQNVSQRNCAPEEMMGNFNAIEQSAGMGAPTLILPDFHYLYPVPQYGAMPEEYYAYGYDPTMHPPATALMPTGYYMYPPSGAPPTAFAPAPNNVYMQAAPPLPPPLITSAAPHPNAAAVAHGVGSGPFYQANPPFGCVNSANAIEINSVQNNTTQIYETPITRNRVGRQTQNIHTPLSGRINWDAKKSVEPSGIDLPTDVHTLRHFYNLGLEYHLMQVKRSNEDGKAKVNGGKITSKGTGGNHNEDVVHENKSDANNNSMPNLNANAAQNSNSNANNIVQGVSHTASTAQNQHFNNSGSGSGSNSGYGKGGHTHRRFPPRYFNSHKERPLFLRNQGTTNSNNTCAGQNQNNHNQNDYNNNNPHIAAGGGGNCKFPNAQKSNNAGQNSSNRSATPNSSHSHASLQNAKSQNTNTGSGGTSNNVTASLAVTVAEHGMPSPHGNYDNSTNGCGAHNSTNAGKMATQTPLATYQTTQANAMMTSAYSPYGEFNGDSPMSIIPPSTAAGGIYLHMPMPAPAHSFGIYAPQPPPPPNNMGMHPTPTSSTACTALSFPAPPNGVPVPQFLASPSEAVNAVNMALHGGPSNGFYPTAAELTAAEAAGAMHGSDGLQFQCIPYAGGAPPPPMPFYYAPGTAIAAGGLHMNGIATVPQPPSQVAGGTAGGGGGGGGCGNAGMPNGPLGPQGYWCQPPPNALLPLPKSTPQTNGGSGSGNNTPNANANNAANSRTRDNK